MVQSMQQVYDGVNIKVEDGSELVAQPDVLDSFDCPSQFVVPRPSDVVDDHINDKPDRCRRPVRQPTVLKKQNPKCAVGGGVKFVAAQSTGEIG